MDVNEQLVEVFFKISRVMKEEMSYNSTLMKLTMVQIQALVYLKKNPDCLMSDVAMHFQIELPSATSLINALEKLSLIERKSDEKDKRQVRLNLTATGFSLLTDAMKIRSEKMKKNLNYLSQEDKKSLLSILERLYTKLEESHEK